MKKPMTVTVEDRLVEKLAKEAHKREVSRSRYIETILENRHFVLAALDESDD